MSLAGIAGAVHPGAALAEPVPAKIDVHHHIVPPQWLAAYPDHYGISQVANWTPEASIEQMNAFGIRTAFTSISTPGSRLRDPGRARSLARDCNEYAARNALDHPGRFGFFAAVPLPDVEGSFIESTYALDVLGADGIAMLTSYDEKWPGDPVFAAFFDELNRRRAVVFVHPTGTTCCSSVLPGVSEATVEYLFNTTRAMISLLINGTFTRCPNIRFIFTHCGGTMPMAADRLVRNIAERPDVAARFPRGPLYELRRQYFDVTSSTSEPTLTALLRFAPAQNVLFGTDYPYVPMAVTAAGLRAAKITSAERAAIDGSNARAFLPRAEVKKENK